MTDAQALHDLHVLLAARPAAPAFGWKVALNASSTQRRLGISHSLAAPLDGGYVLASGADCNADAASQLHMEAELALTLAADVTTPLPLSELRGVIASYTPCLELVDYALPRRDLAGMLAHSFFHAGVVLGEDVAAADYAPLSATHPRVTSGGRLVRERSPGAVPDDIVVTLQALSEWVIAAGGALRRGQRVLCGSYVDPVPFPRGASLLVDYGAGFAPLSICRR
jgi:2-keto-4-pentenoate hydratase